MNITAALHNITLNLADIQLHGATLSPAGNRFSWRIPAGESDEFVLMLRPDGGAGGGDFAGSGDRGDVLGSPLSQPFDGGVGFARPKNDLSQPTTLACGQMWTTFQDCPQATTTTTANLFFSENPSFLTLNTNSLFYPTTRAFVLLDFACHR